MRITTETRSLGRILIWFFASLGSDEFSEMREFDFQYPNLSPKTARFDHDHWMSLHEAGLASYLNIACKINPVVLLPFNKDGTPLKNELKKVKSLNSFIVEVPQRITRRFIDILPTLQQLSGCVHIAHHIKKPRASSNFNTQIILWPKGTPNHIQKLKKMLAVMPELNPSESPAQTSERMKQLLIDKINKIVGNE